LPTKEKIYKEGDPVDEIYFILKGRVKMVTNNNLPFKEYVQGSMFGDNDIFQDTRDATAICVQDCELRVL